MILDATPLVGSLGAACYAPCETACTRGELEGPVAIRRLKRFVAERHYDRADGPGVNPAQPNGRRVAIVGSGPAGLTAAWHLARAGYGVRIFESGPEPGGFLRHAIPAFRLPAEVVDRDIANLTAIGVVITTGTPVRDLAALRADGYDAVLVDDRDAPIARARHSRRAAGGRRRPASTSSATSAKGGRRSLEGRRVVVVGGGNVAMDAARSARSGSAHARPSWRTARSREEMPALRDRSGRRARRRRPVHVPDRAHAGAGRRRTGLRAALPAHGARRAGRIRPAQAGARPGQRVRHRLRRRHRRHRAGTGRGRLRGRTPRGRGGIRCGRHADPAEPSRLAVRRRRRGDRRQRHRARGRPGTTRGIHDRSAPAGRRAWCIRAPRRSPRRRWTGPRFSAGSARYARRDPELAHAALAAAPRDFAVQEPSITEDEARAAAGRCLDCGVCSECGRCITACPAKAIDLGVHGEDMSLDVGAVVVATGYRLFPADAKPQYGYGRFPNVITGMQMERLLSPTRPYPSVLRPSDGRIPSESRTSCAPAPATRAWATRSAPGSAACTRSSRTS